MNVGICGVDVLYFLTSALRYGMYPVKEDITGVSEQLRKIVFKDNIHDKNKQDVSFVVTDHPHRRPGEKCLLFESGHEDSTQQEPSFDENSGAALL